MKKIISSMLVAILLIGSLLLPVSGSLVSASQSSVYHDLLMKYVDRAGISAEDYGGVTDGIVYTKLVQPAPGKGDHLYILFLERDGSEYREVIYQGDSIIYENTHPGMSSGITGDHSIQYAEKDGYFYLQNKSSFSRGGLTIEQWRGYFHSDIYGYDGLNFEHKASYSTIDYSYDMYAVINYVEKGDTGSLNEGDFPEEVYEAYDRYKENGDEVIFHDYEYWGEPVSEDELMAHTAQYDHAEWKTVVAGDIGMNRPVVDSAQSLDLVFDQLGGGDIAQSNSEAPESEARFSGDYPLAELSDEARHTLIESLNYSRWIENDPFYHHEPMSDRELMSFLAYVDGVEHLFTTEYNFMDDHPESSEFPDMTVSRVPEHEIDDFSAFYIGQAFPDEDFSIGEEPFPFVKQGGYYYFPEFQLGIAGYTLTYAEEIYELADDLYYIDFTHYLYEGQDLPSYNYDTYRNYGATQAFDHISDQDRKHLHELANGYAVMKRSRVDDGYQWGLLERDTVGGSFDESMLSAYQTYRPDEAQIELNPDVFRSGSFDLDETVTVIETALDGVDMNDRDQSLLALYLNAALQRYAMTSISSEDNLIEVSAELINDWQKELTGKKEELLDATGVEEENLNRTVVAVQQISVDYLDTTEPIRMHFDSAMNEVLSEQKVDSLYFSFDGGTKGVHVDTDQLKRALSQASGDLSMKIDYRGDGVEVSFGDDQTDIERTGARFSLLAPVADSPMTVYRTGQFISSHYYDHPGSLLFGVPASGIYDIREESARVSQLNNEEQMTEEEIMAVLFMMNRSFFEWDEKTFDPSSSVSRGAFARALVKLFLALDDQADTTFTDVGTTSDYYSYIASGEEQKIIFGYTDGTFREERRISIAEVLAMAGRTLADHKGYQYPQRPEDYLDYRDFHHINDEMKGSISLAVREGLIDQGGLLEPNRPMMAQEASIVLQRLYELVYEDQTFNLQAEVKGPQDREVEEEPEMEPEMEEETSFSWLATGGAVAVTGTVAGVVLWRRFRT